ncbi:hypothetical protein MFLAVUS_006983 [Mucor flavus]|uniref:Uncharacterized protein n=1 Tax=Mucor flavus TaxID=439312 RepID=A0ABP9Z318_9FUNG
MILLLKFKIDIEATIQILNSVGIPLKVAEPCEQLTNCIIDSYDNEVSLFVYKNTRGCFAPTKELDDGSFKMVKVLKDMLYTLHKTAPNSVREFLVAFLMFVLVNIPVENKFSLVLCDSPMGYVTRINCIDPLFLPEEPSDINIKLFIKPG